MPVAVPEAVAGSSSALLSMRANFAGGAASTSDAWITSGFATVGSDSIFAADAEVDVDVAEPVEMTGATASGASSCTAAGAEVLLTPFM